MAESIGASGAGIVARLRMTAAATALLVAAWLVQSPSVVSAAEEPSPPETLLVQDESGDSRGQVSGRSLEGDPQAIEEGRRIFNIHCGACHGIDGKGGIGPNFTDNLTLHADTYEEMVEIVTHGVPGRPMMPWKNKLSPSRIRQVVAYVYSLKGTRPGSEPKTRPYTLMQIVPRLPLAPFLGE